MHYFQPLSIELNRVNDTKDSNIPDSHVIYGKCDLLLQQSRS